MFKSLFLFLCIYEFVFIFVCLRVCVCLQQEASCERPVPCDGCTPACSLLEELNVRFYQLIIYTPFRPWPSVSVSELGVNSVNQRLLHLQWSVPLGTAPDQHPVYVIHVHKYDSLQRRRVWTRFANTVRSWIELGVPVNETDPHISITAVTEDGPIAYVRVTPGGNHTSDDHQLPVVTQRNTTSHLTNSEKADCPVASSRVFVMISFSVVLFLSSFIAPGILIRKIKADSTKS